MLQGDICRELRSHSVVTSLSTTDQIKVDVSDGFTIK